MFAIFQVFVQTKKWLIQELDILPTVGQTKKTFVFLESLLRSLSINGGLLAASLKHSPVDSFKAVLQAFLDR